MNLATPLATLLLFTLGSSLAAGPTLLAADCNRNGVDDGADIVPNDLSLQDVSAYPAAGIAQPRPVVLIAADLSGDSGVTSAVWSTITVYRESARRKAWQHG